MKKNLIALSLALLLVFLLTSCVLAEDYDDPIGKPIQKNET